MRPVQKLPWPQENGANKTYSPPSTAKPDLEDNLDSFCSYCEVFSSDLEIEHVISQDQDSGLKHDWPNFLLSCGRCNGKSNKSNKPVDLETMHFPHQNNTMLSFEYLEGGFVRVNPDLEGDSATHATAMLDLVGLDKRPGHPSHKPNDTRWKYRRIVWEWAVGMLQDFESQKLNAKEVVDFAYQRGFFSVWFRVFSSHGEVKKKLIDRFKGTAQSCFDPQNGYTPIPRNPENEVDPV